MQALLLAAGRGRRFGSDKLLHPVAGGIPLALAAARNLQAALPGALAVVNGENPELMALLEEAGLRTTVCPHAAQGMGASLAWGVAQTRNADGWLIALADMPWVRPDTILAVAGAVAGGLDIAAPVFQGKRGHPVAFGREHGGELAGLAGDEGARHLLAAHAARLLRLDCDDPGVIRDVDTRAAL